MVLTGISLLGWLHSIACVIALAIGAYVLGAPKGTRSHLFWGWFYSMAILVQSLLVMAVYNFDFIPGQKTAPGPRTFGFFHVGALLTMAAIVLALFAASRQRKSLAWCLIHIQAMLFTYYLLINALINELFGRVDLLRNYALSLSPYAGTTLSTALVRYSQLALSVAWASAAIWLTWKVTGRRRPPEPTTAYPMRYSGGAFAACVGLGIAVGAITGGHFLFWGFCGGVAIGTFIARYISNLTEPVFGSPSVSQSRALAVVVTSEFAVFQIVASGGLFVQMSRAAEWDTGFAIVGFHFALMGWSHGRLMVVLGILLLAWLSIAICLHLPLQLVALGAGLLKISFGIVMAWPAIKRWLLIKRELDSHKAHPDTAI